MRERVERGRRGICERGWREGEGGGVCERGWREGEGGVCVREEGDEGCM